MDYVDDLEMFLVFVDYEEVVVDKMFVFDNFVYVVYCCYFYRFVGKDDVEFQVCLQECVYYDLVLEFKNLKWDNCI